MTAVLPLDRLTVGIVQMGMVTDPTVNLARALGFISDAAEKGAQLVCLPELFSWQYFCQTKDFKNFSLAEPIPGPTTQKNG